jgi:hypothetical protein
MAQTGYTPISLYYSTTASTAPTAGNLIAGELAINTTDGKLYYKDTAGVVQTIATKATAALPTTTTGSGSIVLATSPSITTPALSGSTSGSVVLAVPAVAGSNTATFPASTGTVMVSGNMPAFSAYNSSATSLSTGAFTKIQFQTEEFDTANCFDNATNYRFTPNVAGYYQVTFVLAMPTGTYPVGTVIYKNGSRFKDGNFLSNNSTTGSINVATALISMNGTTDYLECYGYQSSGGSVNCNTGANQTYFQAVLVRAA